MLVRLSPLLLAGVLAAGCAPDADEQAEAPAAEATAESATAADEAAIEQISADYVTHYNMQHADVVANLYADSAFALFADGANRMNRAEVLEDLQADVAGAPTLDLTTGDVMVMGDNAVGHGTWSVRTTMEGAAEPMTVGGHYMTYFVRVNGEWKIGGVITNFGESPPAGMPMVGPEGDPPPDEGTMGEMVNAYVQAFNAGDAAAVSNMYTEDGFHAYANLPPAQGRSAIASTLQDRFAAGQPTIEIHDVGTVDLGNGWAIDGGWYVMTAPGEGGATMAQNGAYLNLLQRQTDGTWKIHWGVSNGNPAT